MSNKKKALIKTILEIEWDMFEKVPNIGGLAKCQSDKTTFEINRYAQAMTWSEEVLDSYLIDLDEAIKQNRNIMTEKYGRMMESTNPEEFIKIKEYFPTLSREINNVVEDITKIEIEWQEEIRNKYPNILKSGRPVHSSDDSPNVTSFETYLKAELSTYSLRTNKLLYKDILKKYSENQNSAEISLEYALKKYGYNSAEEANEKL